MLQIKKIPNKIQHCWNFMPTQYTLSWVVCSIQTLPPHESRPCKGRLISISERKNILFFLTALSGTWCKTAALSAYLSGKFLTSHCKTILLAYVNSFSTAALRPLPEPYLNHTITLPYYFTLKIAEPREVTAKTRGLLLRELSEMQWELHLPWDSCSNAEKLRQEAAALDRWKMPNSWLEASHSRGSAEP